MNDFQEELASARVENKDGSVDRLCCQVAFESLAIKKLKVSMKSICVVGSAAARRKQNEQQRWQSSTALAQSVNTSFFEPGR